MSSPLSVFPSVLWHFPSHFIFCSCYDERLSRQQTANRPVYQKTAAECAKAGEDPGECRFQWLVIAAKLSVAGGRQEDILEQTLATQAHKINLPATVSEQSHRVWEAEPDFCTAEAD